MKVKLPTGIYEELDVNNVTVLDILKQLKISPSSVLVIMNDQVIPDDTYVNNTDELQILNIFSGG